MKAKPIALFVLAAALLLGLWFLMNPAGSVAQQAHLASSQHFAFDLDEAAPVAILRVAQGDRVTISVRSQRPDALHVHGYDLHLEIAPGERVLEFVAHQAGRFELELHESHRQLATLEVYPH